MIHKVHHVNLYVVYFLNCRGKEHDSYTQKGWWLRNHNYPFLFSCWILVLYHIYTLAFLLSLVSYIGVRILVCIYISLVTIPLGVLVFILWSRTSHSCSPFQFIFCIFSFRHCCTSCPLLCCNASHEAVNATKKDVIRLYNTRMGWTALGFYNNVIHLVVCGVYIFWSFCSLNCLLRNGIFMCMIKCFHSISCFTHGIISGTVSNQFN